MVAEKSARGGGRPRLAVPMLCFYGRNESDALCRGLDSTLVRGVVQDGGHHIGSNFQGIVKEILGRLDVRR